MSAAGRVRPDQRMWIEAPDTPASRGPALVRWTLPPRLVKVPEVRRRLGAVLRGWRVPTDIEDTLLLVVTELTSNAVKHAAIRTKVVRVTVSHSGVHIRLEVADGHPFRPRPLAHTAEDAEDGRGLMIVNLMVTELRGAIDVSAVGTGKAITVRIPVGK